MKKLWIGLLAFAMLLVGGVTLTSGLFVAEAAASDMTIDSVVTAIKNNQDIKLENDIKVTSAVDLKDLIGIKYSGTFDGNGHKITNLSLYSSEETGYLALIPQASGATIKNLKLDGTFTVDLSNVTSGGYVGGLVGYGENTTIENCEIELSKIDGVQIEKKLTFGVMAGELYGSKSQVHQCLVNYDAQINLTSMVDVVIGGIAGGADQSAITNTINYGKLNFTTADDLQAVAGVKQYIGGVVGMLKGQNAKVINCLTGAAITSTGSETLVVGALIGGSSNVDKSLVRFDYFTQESIMAIGDRSISPDNVNKLSEVDPNYTLVTKDVLLNLQEGRLLDLSLSPWDFATVWDYKGGKVVLQRFEKFEFKIADAYEIVLGETAFLDEPTISATEVEYGGSAVITITPNIDRTWLDKITVYKNGQYVEEIEGWTYTITANASTAGTYSFSVSQKSYESFATTKKNVNGGVCGGIKLAGYEGTIDELSLSFNYSDKTKTIVAEAFDVYAFSHWNVYEKDGDGWSEIPVGGFEGRLLNETLNIEYVGSGLSYNADTNTISIGEEIKFEAAFTADPALVDFVKDENILNITFKSKQYESGTPIEVSKKLASVILEITVKKGYELNIQELENAVITLCTTDASEEYVLPYNFQKSDPKPDENGNTIYTFSIDMGAIKNYVDGSNVSIKITSVKAEGNKGSSTTTIVIVVVVVVVVLAAAGVVIFILIRRNRGGGRGASGGKKGKTKTEQAKPKAESYKDYFI